MDFCETERSGILPDNRLEPSILVGEPMLPVHGAEMNKKGLSIKELVAISWLSLPYFPFQKRIVRSLLKGTFVPIRCADGIYLKFRMGDYIADCIQSAGAFEPLTMNAARQIVRRGDTFVDAGANVGLYSVMLSKLVGCKSIAFEPVHETFSVLISNAHLNDVGDLVEALPCALSDVPGVAQMRSPAEGNLGGATMLASAARPLNVSPTLTLRIALNALSIARVKLLKIDVEGAELLVLKGAPLDIIDNIILEWNGTSGSGSVEEFRSSEICRLVSEEFEIRSVANEDLGSTFPENNVLLSRKC